MQGGRGEVAGEELLQVCNKQLFRFPVDLFHTTEGGKKKRKKLMLREVGESLGQRIRRNEEDTSNFIFPRREEEEEVGTS